MKSYFFLLIGATLLTGALPFSTSAQAPLSDCFREGVYGSEAGPFCGYRDDEGVPKHFVPEVALSDCGCDLCDAIEVGANIILLLTRLVGAVALLMVVYGGISYVLALGNEQSLGRAKQILTNAITGLVIVLVSYLIVSFIIQKLSPGRSGSILWTQFSCTVTTP
ncbi:MAG: hypothetical protein HY459_01920, partial [Parcubacteria group bacterium]|nr:hypothetical protein [Parcubacteria group bacterium]